MSQVKKRGFTREEFEKWESQQLLYLFVGLVMMLVIYAAFKITVAHFSLPVQQVEPFRYQMGVKV